MEGTEARQRRSEGCGRSKESGPLPSHDAGRLPKASEEGHSAVSESQSVDAKSSEAPPGRETSSIIGFQVVIPFSLAGMGSSWAGLLSNYFQHWPVFKDVKDSMTLVPPLVGSKGNSEMTSASRLSTSANTGQIDDRQERYKIISSNLAVVQVQATVVGLSAAVASSMSGTVSHEEFDWSKVALSCTSSVITAFLAALALGILMICIVIGARKFGVNPDNIATPIAASSGDLITSSISALMSSFFYSHKDTWYSTPSVCVGFLALTPSWLFIAKQNPPIMKISKYGWFPIISAMIISSFGGLISSKTISKHEFKGMAVSTPVMCGVGGNSVAIQTSRISTFSHMWSTPGVLPVQMKRFWPNPCFIFCSSEINSVSARVSLFSVVPGHSIFFYLICSVEGQSVTNSKIFILSYSVAGVVQVVISSYSAEVTVRSTWHQASDPDNHCIPYLTGSGDSSGTSSSASCFFSDWLSRGRANLQESVSESVSVPP